MIRTLFRAPTAIAALSLTMVAVSPSVTIAQTEGDYLYNVTMLRAAPGHFNDLIETLEESADLHVEAGDGAPFWMRHSQGDQWDFMLIYPVGSNEEYFSQSRMERRQGVWADRHGRDVSIRLEAFTSYHEEWFARSAPLDEMTSRFEDMGMFHIEMFAGLPGKRSELIEQRRMENGYYTHLGRQLNMIFTRASGTNWDAMTIGFYTDLQTYAAAGVRFSEAEQDEAARAAGFDGVGDISPYLRSLLSYHHDTIAVRVR
jgi:hypothetical protein